VGVEFNRFTAFVRKRFGKVSVCRVFESFENGYPHIHCILLFVSTWFSVFRDEKNQFRVHSKKIIAKGWHSNVGVKAMHSLAGGFSYQKKYLLKNIYAENADSKTLKTLALCWAYRKRAFSVSGLFRQLLSDFEYLHNSNLKSRQVTLSGEILIESKFHVIGFVPADVVCLKKDAWFTVLGSEQIEFVEQYLSRAHQREMGHKQFTSTLQYIDYETAVWEDYGQDEWVCKVVGTAEEAKELIEVGFEFVNDIDNKHLYRERK